MASVNQSTIKWTKIPDSHSFNLLAVINLERNEAALLKGDPQGRIDPENETIRLIEYKISQQGNGTPLSVSHQIRDYDLGTETTLKIRLVDESEVEIPEAGGQVHYDDAEGGGEDEIKLIRLIPEKPDDNITDSPL